MKRPRIGVVILNWRGADDTLQCLESLANCAGSEHLHPIVIDNASGDDSVARIESWASDNRNALNVLDWSADDAEEVALPSPPANSTARFTLIRSTTNIGFCKGNNLGARYAFATGADFVLVLNNDTTVHGDFGSDLVRALESDNGCTLYSPQIARFDEPEQIWWFGGIFLDTLLPKYVRQREPVRRDLEDPVPTEWVSGCATIVSRSVYDRIGLFDPIFFIWAEEWDLSLRARSAQVALRILPKPLVYHKAGQSLGVISPMMFFYSTRNVLIMRRKHLPTLKHLAILLHYIPHRFGASVKLAIRFRDWTYIQAYFDAMLSTYKGGIWRRQR